MPAEVIAALPAPEAPRVAKALEDDIIFGRIEPGSRLVEDVLIARFGATRHGVRQALFELERSGIVVRERNKGVSVRSMSATEVGHVYEVREVLQRQAALRIRLPAAPALIDALESLHDRYGRCLEAGDFRGVHESNDAFHLKMFEACGNPHLVDSIRHFMWLTLPVRAKKTADVGHARASQREHASMIRLLQGTDSWALAQLCVDHLQAPKNSYLRRAGPDPSVEARHAAPAS